MQSRSINVLRSVTLNVLQRGGVCRPVRGDDQEDPASHLQHVTRPPHTHIRWAYLNMISRREIGTLVIKNYNSITDAWAALRKLRESSLTALVKIWIRQCSPSWQYLFQPLCTLTDSSELAGARSLTQPPELGLKLGSMLVSCSLTPPPPLQCQQYPVSSPLAAARPKMIPHHVCCNILVTSSKIYK